MQKLSKVVSYVFHPVFIPTYLLIALKIFAPLPVFFLFISDKLFIALLGLVTLYTAIIPLLFVYLQYRMGFVKDFTLNSQRERPRVYLLTSGFFVALSYFLYTKGSVFMPTAVIVASMGVTIFGLFLFTFFDKISAHTSGLGGVLGIFYGIFFRYGDISLIPIILLVLVLLGLVATSRLYLGAHNLRQVILGAIWGFVTSFVAVKYFMIL